VRENPVIKCLERLKELGFDDDDLDEMVGLLDELVGLFTGVEGSGNVAIGVRNGGLELVCSICSNIPIVSEKVLVSALKTLALLIHGMCFYLYRMMLFVLLDGWFMDLKFGV